MANDKWQNGGTKNYPKTSGASRRSRSARGPGHGRARRVLRDVAKREQRWSPPQGRSHLWQSEALPHRGGTAGWFAARHLAAGDHLNRKLPSGSVWGVNAPPQARTGAPRWKPRAFFLRVLCDLRFNSSSPYRTGVRAMNSSVCARSTMPASEPRPPMQRPPQAQPSCALRSKSQPNDNPLMNPAL